MGQCTESFDLPLVGDSGHYRLRLLLVILSPGLRNKHMAVLAQLRSSWMAASHKKSCTVLASRDWH